MEDDVPEETKKRRLTEIVKLQREHCEHRTRQNINKTVEILIEKTSKKSDQQWSGRTSDNTVAVFPKEHYKVGDLVKVHVTNCTSATLIGEAIGNSKNN